jgi:hypothetical protein
VLPEGTNPFTPSSDSGLSVWAIVGISLGGFFLLILIAILLIWCRQKGKGESDAAAVVYEQEN